MVEEEEEEEKKNLQAPSRWKSQQAMLRQWAEAR